MAPQPKVLLKLSIPETTVKDPLGAIIDGFTMIHATGGMPAVEKALESVMDVVYAD